MLLILAHHSDAEAQWLYTALAMENRFPATLLLPEALGIDYDITLELQNSGQHRIAIDFYAPPARLLGSAIVYLINRLSYIDPLVWKNAAVPERTYATTELNAFFPALIEALHCPVTNPVRHGSLYGDSAFGRRWIRLLEKQGFPVHPDAAGNPDEVYRVLNHPGSNQLLRLMLWDGEIIRPAGQVEWAEEERLQDAIRDQACDETLEFIFFHNSDLQPQLLFVSKTPALSAYGEQVTGLLHRKMNSLYDTRDRNPQRNALAAAY